MKNNKGFGKFEILTMIVILLAIFAFLAYSFLQKTDSKKLATMKDNAINFSKVTSTNIETFHNINFVYLQEVIDEGLMGNIKRPEGGGNCSTSESYVQVIDNKSYVTLKCGNLLIEKANFAGKSDVDVYEVSDWSLEKSGEDDEEKVLYNCEENGKELFSEYYEDLYFVYEINKKYHADSYSASDVKNCTVLKKTFYRTKKHFEKIT